MAGALAAGIGAGVGASLVNSGTFASGFIGTSATTATGFGAGALTGLSAGATNGFIVGTGNALIQKKDFGDALLSGIDQAWKQGLTGALAGGVVGGIDAVRNSRDFWTGARMSPKETYLAMGDNGKLINSGAEAVDGQAQSQATLISTQDPNVTTTVDANGVTYTCKVGRGIQPQNAYVQGPNVQGQLINSSMSRGTISINYPTPVNSFSVSAFCRQGLSTNGINFFHSISTANAISPTIQYGYYGLLNVLK